jgi:hypothetical protein
MNEIVNFSDVEKRIISLRNQQVILDSDVAELYRVELCSEVLKSYNYF